MIPKANFLQLPTIIVGLLLLSLNFVAVAEVPAAAAQETEVHGPTFHGLINIDDNQENLQIMCKKRCSSLVNSSQPNISEEQRRRLAKKLTDTHADWLDECYFVIRCKQDYMTSSDGSGDELVTDDEDQGSGNDEDVYPSSGTSVQPELSAVTNAPTLKEKLTPCLRQHKEHKESGNIYVPHCTKRGGYHKLQCTKHACWCVGPNGVIIKGTNRSESDEQPDCENGINLSPCLKSLLKHSSGLLGSFRPMCSESGAYNAMQCHESKCWCVDRQGTEAESTRVNLPHMPTCVETTPIPSTTMRSTPTATKATPTTTEAATTTSSTTTSTTTIKLTSTMKKHDFLPKNPPNAPLYLTPLLAVMPPLISLFGENAPTPKAKPKGIKYDVNGQSVTSLNEVTSPENHNLAGSGQSKSDNATPVTREPGIMAAIIAGAVVGLFVSILLAMFVVYRMRKKDEGSYPLDEPSKNNYTYTKAPDKEFYA